MVKPKKDSINTINVITGTREIIMKNVKDEGANLEFPPRVINVLKLVYSLDDLIFEKSDFNLIFSKK